MKSETRQGHKYLAFDAIGTRWSIDFETAPDEFDSIKQQIFQLIDEYDKVYSRFRKHSTVTAMAEKAGTYKLPIHSTGLIKFYKKLYELTDGAVSPLVGQTLSDAGYDADYSLRFKTKTVAPKWDDVLTFSGHELTLRKPALLDFGAAGKGQLVDLVCQLLDTKDISEYNVNAGGDIRYKTATSKVHSIALQHPDHPDQAIGVAKVSNKAICGSSIRHRAWQNHHHIIDPRSAEPIQSTIAAWVIAETTMIADGLSTALFFVSPKVLESSYTFEYALLRSDFSVDYSTDFPAEFF